MLTAFTLLFRPSKHSGFTAKAGRPETGKPRCAKGKHSSGGLPTRSMKANNLEEFENIGEDEVVYKLVGPVLLKQETFEAESTVKGRLDFIGGEMLVTTPYACEF